MKQSVVGFLEEELSIHFTFDQQMQLEELFQQAKEMEEKQMKDAWNNGVLAKTFDKKFEDYYNEKYGN